MLTIFRILDHDDYWLALQKPGYVPKIFLFTYSDESPKWEIVPVLRKLAQQIAPRHRIRTVTCDLSATLDCIRKQMEIGKPVKIRFTGATPVFTLRPGDNESVFLNFALKHWPGFLREFSGCHEATAKLEVIA